MAAKTGSLGNRVGAIMIEHINSKGPNRDEIDYWNGPQGQNWVNENRLSDLMYDPFGDMAIVRAGLTAGENILDIGCGCGTTTLKLANLVAPGGAITCLDISTLMLAIARQRSKSAAVPVNIVNADAETYECAPASFDVMFSQFGVMFFANPNVAFSNVHNALRPRGRIAFVCWRGHERNPWLVTPFEAVRHSMPEVEAPNPDAPASPFSFASQEKVELLLGDAGFTDVELEPFETTARMGEGSLEACVDFVGAFVGPVAGIIRGAGEAKTSAIINTLRNALAQYHTGNSIELAASAWIVSARRT
jgi:ubiquinone/menaquinone biosynthesis C-methylase UbiE